MPPRDNANLSDTEDEILALIPAPAAEEVDNQLVNDQEGSDEEPTEVEPMEEDSQEEEPSEEEEQSGEEVVEESEPEEAPPTPVASPRQPSPPRTYREYPDGPLHTFAPNQDPYFPPTPTALPPQYRWAWIRRILGMWRREEGDRVPDVAQTPDMAPVCPITGEPAHLTIPLLVARLYRHENQLYELIEDRRTQPNPDLTLQMHHELRSLRNDHRELCDGLVSLENTAISRINDLEEELRNLRGMMEEMSLRNRNSGGPSPGNGDL